MYVYFVIMLPCVYLFFVFFLLDISDLELVNRLSNGKVDLTFGRYLHWLYIKQ